MTSLPLTRASGHTGSPAARPDSLDSEDYDDIGAA